ncbi:alpha/beta hydrolase [Nocardia goodfellowii]|uniref:Pimeloyl-ACP methyl ester carboxylesterase n=1 Tax=Nocardia goodfellowii TaxID=882446 RepID=A0ABS4QP79_9NOCA|nr:alpha/beta hydrolase [Nocardia goodfellowii]MBP2193502.1 pimeloyl-ACP methyl ester carboxylesterase [Nocardia goodfellowii]
MRHPAAPILNALTYMRDRRISQTPAVLGLAYQDLSIATADGETVHAWWLPARRSVGHVLFAHGNAGNIGDRVPIYALLTDAGFDVLAFDYRGYGRSTGRPSEHGTYLDARAARQALLDRPGVDPERVVYLGKSLGGGVMLELATEYPPAGLILVSTFTGIRDAARGIYPFVPAPLVPDAYPSLRRIREVRAPVLITHGDRDELLPLQHAERLYEAASEPKQLEVFAGAGHNDLIFSAGARWIDLVSTWAKSVVDR